MSALQYKINTSSFEDIYNHLFLEKDNFFPPLDQAVDIRVYSQKITDNAFRFEAWSDKKLVGLIACYFDSIHKKAFITNVSTNKSFSGMGIASYLLNCCIEYSRNLKFIEINLEVNTENLSAINLYKKYNFKLDYNRNNIDKMKKIINE